MRYCGSLKQLLHPRNIYIRAAIVIFNMDTTKSGEKSEITKNDEHEFEMKSFDVFKRKEMETNHRPM